MGCVHTCLYHLEVFFFSEKIGHLLSAALFKTTIKSQDLQRVAIDVKGLKQGFEG